MSSQCINGEEERLVDAAMAANMLQVSEGTLAVWRSTGRHSLPFLKVGCRVRYRLGDIRRWLEQRYRATGITESRF